MSGWGSSWGLSWGDAWEPVSSGDYNRWGSSWGHSWGDAWGPVSGAFSYASSGGIVFGGAAITGYQSGVAPAMVYPGVWWPLRRWWVRRWQIESEGGLLWGGQARTRFRRLHNVELPPPPARTKPPARLMTNRTKAVAAAYTLLLG